MADTKKQKTPRGWLEVPLWVTVGVDQAVESLGPGLSLSEQDAWGAGVSPKVAKLAQILSTKGAKIGPATVESLKKLLLEANDATWLLLGGETTQMWVFAPKEFNAHWDALTRLPDAASDDEIENDPQVKATAELLAAALNANIEAWKQAHGGP
jgi:hypothetical protein